MTQHCEKLRIDLRHANESELSEFAAVLYQVAVYLAELGISLQITPIYPDVPTHK